MEPGAYEISLRYRPGEFHLGAALSAVGWLACTIILCRGWRSSTP